MARSNVRGQRTKMGPKLTQKGSEITAKAAGGAYKGPRQQYQQEIRAKQGLKVFKWLTAGLAWLGNMQRNGVMARFVRKWQTEADSIVCASQIRTRVKRDSLEGLYLNALGHI